jgi:hypothetical protein
MANTTLSHQSADAHEHEKAHPLRIDREGFALLRDRLREANAANPQFDLQHQRLVSLFHTVLRRLETEFGATIECVVAYGDWARYGTDLRNMPFAEIVLLIVVRQHERPFSLYMDIADRVFVHLGDNDVRVQFGLATLEEWRSRTEFAVQRGDPDALGIPLLARAA